jgi:hypothetical protein
LGRFIELLIEETEKVRVKILQVKKHVYIKCRDLPKKEKIQLILMSFEFYSEKELFVVFNNVIDCVLKNKFLCLFDF